MYEKKKLKVIRLSAPSLLFINVLRQSEEPIIHFIAVVTVKMYWKNVYL